MSIFVCAVEPPVLRGIFYACVKRQQRVCGWRRRRRRMGLCWCWCESFPCLWPTSVGWLLGDGGFRPNFPTPFVSLWASARGAVTDAFWSRGPRENWMSTGRVRLVTRLACLGTDCDTGGLPWKNGGGQKKTKKEGTILDNLRVDISP